MNTPKSGFLILLVILLSLNSYKVAGQSATIWKERARLSSIRDSIELINSMNYVGILYQAKDVDSCFYYGLKAKTLSAKLRYTKGETDADNVIAVALSLRGLYRESLEIYSSVLTRYRQQADTANVVQVLMNMALVYAGMADSIKSGMYFHQAMATGRNLKQDSILSMLYVNYCFFTPSLSEDSVNYYLDKSGKIAQKYKSEWVPVLILQARANLMLLRDRRQEALPLIEESLYRARNLNMELLEMNALVHLGNYYKDDVDSALKYYHLANELVIATGYKNVMIPAARTILETTKLTGNTAAISRAHEVLEDALSKENENLKNFIGDYVKYSVIQEDNKLLEISNRNKQTKIWLLIAICVISGLLAVFIYRQYRVSRHLNRKISEQNNSLQKTLTALEESQEENTRIMKIVAHDLRNPIGAMVSIATLLLMEEQRSANDQMMLDLVKTAGENSLELTNDLLLINGRTDELKKEMVDMHQLLRYCVDLLQFKAEKKYQHIHLQAVHVDLLVNREKIWRVISNLITNAIKFSPNNADINVCMEEKPDEVVVAVKDNGIGIPAEMRDKIFQMFTEFKRKGTAGEQSFGLGLAISKQILEAHKGRIWYESKAGSGTTFFMALPR